MLDSWRKWWRAKRRMFLRTYGTIGSLGGRRCQELARRRRGNICRSNFPGNILRNLWVINFMNLRLASPLTGARVPLGNISIMTDCGRSYVRSFPTRTPVPHYRPAGFWFYFVDTSLYYVTITYYTMRREIISCRSRQFYLWWAYKKILGRLIYWWHVVSIFNFNVPRILH